MSDILKNWKRKGGGEIKRFVLVALCNASLYYVLIKRNKIFQRSLPRRIHGSMCFMLLFFFLSKVVIVAKQYILCIFLELFEVMGIMILVGHGWDVIASLSLFLSLFVMCIGCWSNWEVAEGRRMLLAGSNQSNYSYLLYWW